ncbi:UNVERIFIED_CONTAM: Single-stranded DNA-binding protein, mitochondrial [Sesamum indicum]
MCSIWPGKPLLGFEVSLVNQSSMASFLSRKLSGVVLSRYRANSVVPKPSSIAFCTKSLSSAETESSSDSESELGRLPADSSSSRQQPANRERPLENGLDLGIYKAILVGQVGQAPIQKRLRSGKTVTLLSLGTGGIRNNRRPLDNEEPRDYANRCAVQWHRVSVYPERLGQLAMKNLVPGSILYVEGNLETKIFNDPITGLIRRIREVAVRQNGRLLLLGNGNEAEQLTKADIARVGYY